MVSVPCEEVGLDQDGLPASSQRLFMKPSPLWVGGLSPQLPPQGGEEKVSKRDRPRYPSNRLPGGPGVLVEEFGAAARLLPLQVARPLCSSAPGPGALWASVSPCVKQSVAEEQRAWSRWPRLWCGLAGCYFKSPIYCSPSVRLSRLLFFESNVSSSLSPFFLTPPLPPHSL